MSQREQLVYQADQLTQQAIAAAQAGDRDEARALLQQATELDPRNAEAWLWLAGVVDELEEKRRCFQRVLELEPYNEQARLGLQRVEAKLGIAEPAEEEEEVLTCTWHPERETMLRCNRCGRPMCPECAVRHPVGLRCKECVKETRAPIYQVELRDYLVAGIVGLVLSTIAGLIIGLLASLWFVAFFVGPAVGAGIADLMSRSVRKRGRGMAILAGACIVVGLIVAGVLFGGYPAGVIRFLFRIGSLLYLVLGVGAAVARLQ